MNIQYSNLLIFTLGFISQALFFARTIVQWFKSEKAGRILSPVLFWQISLLASIIMLVYGILRKDFAIILGQFITFFIYVRNLQLHNEWKIIPVWFRAFIVLMPFVCLLWVVMSGSFGVESILNNSEIPRWLFFFGIAAQIIFTFRFIYQWLVSEKNKLSALPLGFWYISLVGSLLIFTYALFRLDPVLFIGHMGSMAMYIRNLMLHYTGKGMIGLLPFADIKQIIYRKLNRIKPLKHQ
jgi:lipid-A-disaccharide synthase-like uncharacterized protein